MKELRISVAIFVLVIAALTTAIHAQTPNVLYNFGSHNGDPTDPALGYWAQGLDGNLYSTAPTGGANGDGAAFSFSVSTGLVTVLHNFAGTDGAAPYSGLTLGTDGNFYGTTSAGGEYGAGTIFQITAGGSFTTLHHFTNGLDGGTPIAPPVEGTDGNFYGTTSTGGGAAGCGTVYSITTSGTPTPLHQFSGSDGCDPVAPLVLGNDGYFYGTTYGGGTSQAGTVFHISPAGVFKTLQNFDNANGYEPNGLIQGIDGNFYGTTTVGGASGSGEVFMITTAGAPTVLYNFTGGSDGLEPYTGLVQATNQLLYGVTIYGGTEDGNIFSVSPTSPYPFASLYSFVQGTTGEMPEAPLFQRTDGLLYGDTFRGGSNGEGTIFSLNLRLPPFVRLLPASGNVGATIGILGQGFSGATFVKFNGTKAGFSVSTDSYMTATVPSGATTGTVTVITKSGTLLSNIPFVVTGVTATTLTSSLNPSAYGEAVTFTATVSSSLGSPPDGETVSFMKGAKVLGTGTLSGGIATYTSSTLKVGTTSIKAVYAGDSNFGSSTSNAVNQTVNKSTTATAITSSMNPSNAGQSVTFTATVTPEYTGTITGKVTFYDGATALKTVGVKAGVAKFTTKTLAAGTHTIGATYDGSTSFGPSSNSLTQTVN